MEEIWRPITGYENYEVSNMGNVRTINYRNTGHSRFHKLCIQVDGYKYVCLGKKTFLVHRLVAQAFLEPIEGKQEVDHINRNRLDNTASNLRWCNRVENTNNRKLPSTGHRNITFDNYGYSVHIMRNRQIFTKTVRTLEEAIKIRDDFLRNLT